MFQRGASVFLLNVFSSVGWLIDSRRKSVSNVIASFWINDSSASLNYNCALKNRKQIVLQEFSKIQKQYQGELKASIDLKASRQHLLHGEKPSSCDFGAPDFFHCCTQIISSEKHPARFWDSLFFLFRIHDGQSKEGKQSRGQPLVELSQAVSREERGKETAVGGPPGSWSLVEGNVRHREGKLHVYFILTIAISYLQ